MARRCAERAGIKLPTAPNTQIPAHA
jgi:hypothetical protein